MDGEKVEMLGLLINWNPDVVSLFVHQVNLQFKSPIKGKKLEIPDWFRTNDDITTSENLLMKSITYYLKEAGSNQSFGWSYVGPNTGVQSIGVISTLYLIQSDYFMQEMMRAVQRAAPTGDDDYKFLASLAIISDKDGIVHPFGVLRLNEGNVHLFN